jgi:hypothetical protein
MREKKNQNELLNALNKSTQKSIEKDFKAPTFHLEP